MQTNQANIGKFSALSLAIASLLGSSWARAQQAANSDSSEQAMEEVVTVGRFLSAAESLTAERLQIPFSAEFLSAEVIARAGDPDIASALRRMPGLTLIDNKYVYIRGLGERYANVLVNGAAIPSPDLTRSVVPLDVFPTSIVESIKIQKSPSPDVPSSFGGGLIDIRTNSIPQDLIVDFQVSVGMNGVSDGSGLHVPPESATPLPAEIANATTTYGGQIGVSSILTYLRFSNPLASIGEAQAIHQGLMDSLNGNIGIANKSLDNDWGGRLTLGNSWDINENWQIGASLLVTTSEQYRNIDQERRSVVNPAEFFTNSQRTSFEDRSAAALNFGVNYRMDHSLEISSYKISVDESIASITRGFDPNVQFPDQQVAYDTRIEERELILTQISGEHRFLDTPWFTDMLEARGLEGFEFTWFYSDSEAGTDIPNQTRFQSNGLLNTDGSLITEQVLATTTAGQFTFLDLDDTQNSWGGKLELPLSLDRMLLTLSGGWWGSEKARNYLQHKVNLNSVGVLSAILTGTPGELMSSDDVIVENRFDITVGGLIGNESYLAAQKIDAGFGMVDMEFDNWRFTVGARWEAYRQAVLAYDPRNYNQSVSILSEQLTDPNQRLAIQEDDIYPAIALTRNGSGLLGSSDFQLRASYGETVVRPDLRELAGSQEGGIVYIDPTLDLPVQGNPFLTSSPIDNYELRGEFYYSEGDNFAIALFYKDIQAPIEQINRAASADDFLLGFVNAESGDVAGLELEGLKSLPRGLFLAGNLTLSDSELFLGSGALAIDATNRTRRLSGHSEWVVNATLGYDSPNARHSAYLNYNAFGERIFFAGRAGLDDAYELPFDSLGLVYTYFPTDQLQIQVKLDNILDEKRRFQQADREGRDVMVLVQDVGTTWGVGVRWVF